MQRVGCTVRRRTCRTARRGTVHRRPPGIVLTVARCGPQLRRVVGAELVDSVQALWDEAQTLLDIWTTYRDTPPQASAPQGTGAVLLPSRCGSVVHSWLAGRRLPDPPALRQRITQEIALFAQNIRQFQGDGAL